MRRSLIVAATLTAGLSLGVAAIGGAVSNTLPVGNTVVTFGGTVSPQQLPRSRYVPVISTIVGKISTTDGTHPSAFREAVVDIDKDVKINVKGYPSCKVGPRQLQARDTRSAMKICGSSVIGKGNVGLEIAFPELSLLHATSPLTVFNGGEKGGEITLYLHAFVTVPRPTALVATMTISRKGSGIHSVAKLPVIAGGGGSTIDFKFKLGKTFAYKDREVGYLEAKCPDGVFKVNAPKLLFKNEARTPGVAATTVLKSGLAVPCTPEG